MKYKLKDGESVRTVKCLVSSQTIAAGDLVTLSSGLIIKAAAASAAVAWAPNGCTSTDTTIDVTVGNDFTLIGTGDAVFAVTQKGTEVDITDTNQYVDVGSSSTDVLKIGISTTSGTVGSASKIEVRINKPLF